MDKARWKTINEIFHSALELAPEDRSAFVVKQTQGDTKLYAEIERMLQADEKAENYLESLPGLPDLFVAGPSLQPGDLLKERFRIRRLIGEGGMGQVFEAEDEELGVRVALKAIHPFIAGNPVTEALFRREVRVARAITHTNVCRIYELDRARLQRGNAEQKEILFLTMEFLEGQTLASVISKTGALSLDQALDYARPVASALDAAHAVGVVHRDIKPANIMLVDGDGRRASRVVVADFGLARLEPLAPSANASSFSLRAPAGTLAYMAPEQMEAQEAVTTAADVYAFGLILFEMVTGRRAFPSDNLLSGIALRLKGDTPSPRSIRPDLPDIWESVISICLHRNPSARFASAGAVIAAIENTQLPIPPPSLGLSSSLAPPPAQHKARLLQNLRKWRWAISVGLVAVALFFAWPRLNKQQAESRVSPGALIYLAPVENQTGDSNLNNLTELLKASLAQSTQVNLLDQGRVGDTLQLMTKSPGTPITEPLAREIAMRTGAARVIFARVSGGHGNYQLDVDIQRPDPSGIFRYYEHWSRSFTWKADSAGSAPAMIPAELLAQVRESTNWIRNKVGESANDIGRLDAPPEDVTTNKWEALAEYLNAERLQARQETVQAVFALNQAIGSDPNFSLAYGRLGDLLFSTGRYADGLRAYRQALETDQGRRLTRRERDRILGEFSLDSVDYTSAEQAYRDITIYYQNDYGGWSYRGYPLLMLGRPDEAIATLKRAYALDPTRTNAPWELGRAYISMGNFAEAQLWVKALERQGSPELANYIQGSIAFLTHDYAGAVEAFRAMRGQKRIGFQSWSYLLSSRVAAERGDYSGALNELDAGILFDRQSGQEAGEASKLLARASIEAALENFTACIVNIKASLKLEKSPQRLMVASAILGAAYQHAPQAVALLLRTEIARLEKQMPGKPIGLISDLARLRLRGETLLANGDAEGAVAQFRKAGDLDALANGREYLARGLSVLAQKETNPSRVLALRRSAMEAYAATALRPNLIWFDSVDIQPGYYASQLIAYLRLAKELPDPEKHVNGARDALQAIRGGAFTLSSEPSLPR